VNTTVDPRQARSRKAMLDAARELLAREGPAAVTHQRVARQAGVGRATVYRHWPRPEQLMLDTMAGVELPFFRDPVSPVRPWLWGQLRTFADEIALPAVAGVALAMMNSSGSSLPAEVHDRFSATADTGLRAAVALAVAGGELTGPADPEDILALLSGPLIHRACLQGSIVSDELLDRVIDSIGTWHPRS
jgi:AcrR family transcriptional regulator